MFLSLFYLEHAGSLEVTTSELLPIFPARLVLEENLDPRIPSFPNWLSVFRLWLIRPPGNCTAFVTRFLESAAAISSGTVSQVSGDLSN